MITYDDAAKKFEGETLRFVPTDAKRLVIPAYGFAGAQKGCPRVEYAPPTYEPVKVPVEGLEFHNPKDNATQVLKKDDGCLICYDAPGLKEKVDNYLKENPETFKNAIHLKKFIGFLTENTGDVYDTDIAFASGLVGAPEKLEVGKAFSGAKKKETVQAFKVEEGVVFEGAEGHPQTAGKGGAYILKDNSGMRMVQVEEFNKAYVRISTPKTLTKGNSRTM